MSKIELAKETVEGATMTKAAPAVAGGAVSAMSIAGVSLPDVVYVLTALSLVVSIAYKLWSWRKEILSGKKEEAKE